MNNSFLFQEGLSIAQQDIQVTIAVFASKPISGRVWFLRIVVMKHDPDDTTFKTVKEREIASKYHLIQTYPFSISSDIVVSLKHQCLQFKLTSEDYQVRADCNTFYIMDEISQMSII